MSMLSLSLPYIPLILLHSSEATEDYNAASYFFHPIDLLEKILGNHSVSSGVVHSRRVPSLGGYIGILENIIVCIGCFSGMVFGGIHCIAWNFLFQRRTEQLLWRSACLMILSSLVSVSICSDPALSILRRKWKFLDSDSMGFVTGTIFITSCFAYIAARLILVVLIFLSFRSLPPGVYDTVAWTKFIPHL
jgi:hypothetical protein